MRYIRLALRILFFATLLFCITVFTAVIVMNRTVSREYKINRGDTFKIDSAIPVTVDFKGVKASSEDFKNVGEVFDVDLKILGIIPFSKASVTVVDETYVSVLGTPFGMKIYTNGLLVISTGDVETASGTVNPAQDAGIKVGDYIVSANGERINCNEDLVETVIESGGKPLALEITRAGKSKKLSVTPALDKNEGLYRIGVWVRDSSAGVGTLTFYSPASNVICGLGHGICDRDTGKLLSLEHGELVSAEIISVIKGSAGEPGELKGRFTSDRISDIALNTDNGVYGNPYKLLDTSKLVKVAYKQDIKNGDAQILCTISGDKPKLYSCRVQKRTGAYDLNTQNMIVTVTDKELISATGGIIQGMSGSPILQNGELIGAVTHVFVDDPKKGYAVFAENMLDTAASAEKERLKNAS